MESPTSVGPTIIVILGATGDLTWRKLIPGLYNLYLDNWLPKKFAVIGVSRTDMDENAFRERMKEGIDKFSRRGKAEDTTWKNFAKKISYNKGGFNEDSTYSNL
jgi:glucose-6-phosphate 1-dehydrogenase